MVLRVLFMNPNPPMYVFQTQHEQLGLSTASSCHAADVMKKCASQIWLTAQILQNFFI